MAMDERLARIRTCRNALLDAWDEGVLSADALESHDPTEPAPATRKQA